MSIDKKFFTCDNHNHCVANYAKSSDFNRGSSKRFFLKNYHYKIITLKLFIGTRFRPLSLDIPKPLFPVAGLPVIQHHIEACVALEEVKEILIVGFYQVVQIQPFVNEMQQKYNITIKYLQEFTALGTAGGLYHFRDQIRCGNPDAFFVMNGDVCAEFPLRKLYNFHKEHSNKALVCM